MTETTDPLTVASFVHVPARVRFTDALRPVLRRMTDQAYSQVPVYHEDEYVGLLTTNAIARWLGAHLDDADGILAVDVGVGDVLGHAEAHERAVFVPTDLPAHDAARLLMADDAPTALIITDTGQEHGTALGILVHADVPAMLSALRDPAPD